MKILIKICSIITACLLLQSCSGGDKSSNASKEKFNVELVQESLSIGSTVKNIITFKDKIYFIDKTETELWVSDGTSEGTFIFLDSSFTNEDIRVLIKADDFFYFTTDGQHLGDKLWKSDGTIENTVVISSIRSVSAIDLGVFDNKIFFSGFSSDKSDPWVSDGTADGTFKLKDINPSESSYPKNFTKANGYIYFTVTDSNSQSKIWKTDGTAEGTMLADFNIILTEPSPHIVLGRDMLYSYNDKLYIIT